MEDAEKPKKNLSRTHDMTVYPHVKTDSDSFGYLTVCQYVGYFRIRILSDSLNYAGHVGRIFLCKSTGSD